MTYRIVHLTSGKYAICNGDQIIQRFDTKTEAEAWFFKVRDKNPGRYRIDVLIR